MFSIAYYYPCRLSFVKVAANSRKIAEFGIAKKLGIVVFVGISTPVSNLFGLIPQFKKTLKGNTVTK